MSLHIALIKQKALAKHPDITVQAYEKILTRLHYCLYDEIQEVLNQLYKQLNSKIEMTSDDKLFAIALAVQSLERIHPFSDVNCRTFCMVFLNSLLIQNNFLPALIDDPNKFDGYDSLSLVHLIKEGIQRTKTLENYIKNKKLQKTHSPCPLFNHDGQWCYIPSPQKEMLKEMAETLLQSIRLEGSFVLFSCTIS